MDLTEKLIVLRKQRGLTQLEVAEILNVSRQAISKWESGVAVPSIDNLKYLSEFYGVSVDYLISDREEDAVKRVSSLQEGNEDRGRKSAPINRVKIAVFAVIAVSLLLFALTVTYMKDAKANERNSLSIGSISGEEVDSIPKTSFTIEW